MIRKAQQKDHKEIVDLIMSFYVEGLDRCGLSFDRDSLYKTVSTISATHIMLVADDHGIQGVIAGIFSHSLFDYKQFIAEEKIWFVKKEHRDSGIGMELFKKFEETARLMGANNIIMAHLSNIMPEVVKGIYGKSGYKEIESHYIKSVGG